MIENFEIPITCQECGRQTKKRIGWLERNKEFTCSCSATTLLEGNFRKEIARIKKELKSFGKGF